MLAAFVSLLALPVLAQRPTPREAEVLLQTRPDLVLQLRQRILTSGLSPEQVRARLKAEGYPENLLDAFLPGAAADQKSSGLSRDALAAVRRLGLVDSTDFVLLDSLRLSDSSRVTPEPLAREPRDFVPDSSRREVASRELFGVDLFRSSTSAFDANLSGPVDASYRLGPGDQLVLILTGDVEEAFTLDVTREGFIVVPQVGQIPVSNLTVGQLNEILYSRLSRVYSGVSRGSEATTQFSVGVARLRSNQVFVVGEVTKPGSYRISSAGTALTALYAAGGPSDNGSLRNVQVRRAGRTVAALDVYDYIMRGDATNDIRLLNGDVIFVAVHGPRVRVVGEVTRPATYELKPGESLGQLLTIAGGFTAEASTRRVQIERISSPATRTAAGRDRVLIDVESISLATGGGPALALESGDVVRVFRVSDRVRNRVIVAGNVWSPGAVGLTDGMTVSEAIRRAGGPKSDSYVGQVLISRLQPDSTRTQLRVRLRDTTGAVIDDIPVREDDEIRVFSTTEFRPERYVAISGAVRKPGRYRYADGMTIRDLSLLAGGLEPGALVSAAEIARVPENRTGGVTAQTVRVPLDSSYVIGGDAATSNATTPPRIAPEVALDPYDHVLILRQPDWSLLFTVVIAGEVRFPGRYAIKTKQERIGDVIDRAGGLTPEGYAAGIRFYRQRDEIGRVGLDIPRVLRARRDRDNLLLQDGDSIFVPEYSPVVTVGGAVQSPVAVAYVPGRTIDYYIRAAGGATRTADPKRAFVTQPNGGVESRSRFLIFNRDVTPRAGSVVSVPERDPNATTNWVQVAGSVAQILASLVAIVAVAAR